jgi:hypothetical protein
MNICKCACAADSASVTAPVPLTVSMGHLLLNEKHLTCDWHFGYLRCVNCCFDRASQTSGDCQRVLSCQTFNLRHTLSDRSNRRLIMVVHQERSLSLERVTTRLTGPEALLAPSCRQSASHWDCVNYIATSSVCLWQPIFISLCQIYSVFCCCQKNKTNAKKNSESLPRNTVTP